MLDWRVVCYQRSHFWPRPVKNIPVFLQFSPRSQQGVDLRGNGPSVTLTGHVSGNSGQCKGPALGSSLVGYGQSARTQDTLWPAQRDVEGDLEGSFPFG